MSDFDAYHKWLGISPKDQPPHHYRLLGIKLFECDPEVIGNAADQRKLYVCGFQTGPASATANQLRLQIEAARDCLLDPRRKREYDRHLNAALQSKRSPATMPTEPPPTPAELDFQPVWSHHKSKKRNSTFQILATIGIAVAVLAIVLAFIKQVERQIAQLTPPSDAADATIPTDVLPDAPPAVNMVPKHKKPSKPVAEDVPPAVKPEPEPIAEIIKPEPEPDAADAMQPFDADEPDADEPEPEELPKEKLPVPDAAAQEKTLATIRDVYKADYEDADKAALAKKLIQKARETQDPTGRFMLLLEAKDVAADAFWGELAFEAIDALVDEFQVGGPAMKADVLEKAAKKPRILPEQKAAIADAALTVIDEATAADNFEVAQQLGRLALQLVRFSKEKELLQTILAKNKDVDAGAKAYSDAQEAMAKLEENPADADANLTVGKYLCLARGDWQQGLPMLVLGSDAALKALAERDIKGPTAPADQVKLADAWWDAGWQPRAAYWYEKALPGLTGLDKDRVEKRIADAVDYGMTAGDMDNLPRSDGLSPVVRKALADALMVLTFERSTRLQRDGKLFLKNSVANKDIVAESLDATFGRGLIGSGAEFDGSKGAIKTSVEQSKTYAIALWVKLAEIQNGDCLIGSRNDGFGYTISFRNTEDLYLYAVTDKSKGLRNYLSHIFRHGLNINTWHHLVFLFDHDKGMFSYYLDGKLMQTISLKLTQLTKRVVLFSFITQAALHGVIDEAAIFQRPLTPTEIEAIYRLGKSGRSLAGKAMYKARSTQMPTTFHTESSGARLPIKTHPAPLPFDYFALQARQAGSTIDVDDLRVTDLNRNTVVYNNDFNDGSTKGLRLLYSEKGSSNPFSQGSKWVVDGSKTRIVQGRLRLECEGFKRNGGRAYDSCAKAILSSPLPRDFMIELTVKKLQWPGHFAAFMFKGDISGSAVFYLDVSGYKVEGAHIYYPNNRNILLRSHATFSKNVCIKLVKRGRTIECYLDDELMTAKE